MQNYVLLVIAVATVYLTSDAARVKEIGDEIIPSVYGVEKTGSTFLINELVMEEGVLFAYSAFFRNNEKVRFQVWRTIDEAQQQYQLLAETRVIPTVKLAREDIYIVASTLTDSCVRVMDGDKIGVFFESAPGAVSYVFDKDAHVLKNSLDNLTNPHEINDIVQFDRLPYPYIFSVLVYIDTNLSMYDNETFQKCPDLMIPKYDEITLPPQPAVTGKPGATGPQGPPGATGERGDRGPIGGTGAEGPMGSRGYNGSNGAIGADGLRGPPGEQGDRGDEGPPGGTGEKGEKGYAGPRGLPGPPGHNTSTGPNPQGVRDDSDSLFTDPDFILGLFIWLIAVTVGLILLTIVFIVVRATPGRRRQKPTIYSERVQSGAVEPGRGGALWMGDLKEQSEADYSNATLTTPSSPPPFEYRETGTSNGAYENTAEDTNTLTKQTSIDSAEMKNY